MPTYSSATTGHQPGWPPSHLVACGCVLLEDRGDSVTVSIRDDGVGIADGRLAEAVDEGRLGIAKSIVGRLDWLGGSAKLHTGPGCGTEWELTIPRR